MGIEKLIQYRRAKKKHKLIKIESAGELVFEFVV